jgi:hypothetical protein
MGRLYRKLFCLVVGHTMPDGWNLLRDGDRKLRRCPEHIDPKRREEERRVHIDGGYCGPDGMVPPPPPDDTSWEKRVDVPGALARLWSAYPLAGAARAELRLVFALLGDAPPEPDVHCEVSLDEASSRMRLLQEPTDIEVRAAWFVGAAASLLGGIAPNLLTADQDRVRTDLLRQADRWPDAMDWDEEIEGAAVFLRSKMRP